MTKEWLKRRKITNKTTAKCLLCGSKDLISVFNNCTMPIYNLELHYDRKSALNAKRGELEFYFCKRCLFVFNWSFGKLDYKIQYDNARNHSAYYRNYISDVCEKIDQVLRVTNKTVVEIGSGNGEFLKMLRRKYKFKAFGFDPSYQKISDRPVVFVNKYFNRDSFKDKINILILRHVLEHQKDPFEFFDSIMPLNKKMDRSVVYIEVPAWEWIINNNFFGVFSYEHCSYYTSYSLAWLLKRYGYNPVKISFAFKNEYLQYFGSNNSKIRLDGLKKSEFDSVIEKTKIFKRNSAKTSIKVQQLFKLLGKKSVLWGAAGKGTALLNMLGITYKDIEYVIDNNPKRHNTYIPGGGQIVLGADRLRGIKPENILLTNSAYLGEIKRQISSLGLNKMKFICLDKMINEICDS